MKNRVNGFVFADIRVQHHIVKLPARPLGFKVMHDKIRPFLVHSIHEIDGLRVILYQRPHAMILRVS